VRAVRYAATFASRLEAIREYLLRVDPTTAASRFEHLVDDLARAEALIAEHPGLGRRAGFLDHGAPRIRAARTAFESLLARLPGAELREYVLRGYLVLYLVQADSVTLLAIRSARERGYRG
jgi:plasmid stabilization system protein ParE